MDTYVGRDGREYTKDGYPVAVSSRDVRSPLSRQNPNHKVDKAAADEAAAGWKTHRAR